MRLRMRSRAPRGGLRPSAPPSGLPGAQAAGPSWSHSAGPPGPQERVGCLCPQDAPECRRAGRGCQWGRCDPCPFPAGAGAAGLRVLGSGFLDCARCALCGCGLGCWWAAGGLQVWEEGSEARGGTVTKKTFFIFRVTALGDGERALKALMATWASTGAEGTVQK